VSTHSNPTVVVHDDTTAREHHHAKNDPGYAVYSKPNNGTGPYLRDAVDRDANLTMQTQLPPRALHSNLQSYTVSLKSYKRDFDATTFPVPLRGRVSPAEYTSHVEKVNQMMKERPRDMGGMVKKADSKARAWAAFTILGYIFLALSVVAFLAAFTCFWVFLGIAVDNVDFDSWWWVVVLCGALWTVSCFLVALATVFVVFANQKWRKWRKVADDEATLEKYHSIVRYLRRENERTFASEGIVWTLELPTPPKSYYYGWTKHVYPTLDIIVFHQPQTVHRFVAQAAPQETIVRERMVQQQPSHIVSQRVVEEQPMRVVREGTTSSQSRQADKETIRVKKTTEDDGVRKSVREEIDVTEG